MKRFLYSTIILLSLPFMVYATTFGVDQGGTGSSSLSTSQLIFGAGKNPVQSVATTSVGCSGSVTCSNFVVVGTSPITIIGSGGGGGSGNVSTSSSESPGFLSYWTSNAATPALLGKVATSSLGITAPITFSGTLGSQVGGSGGNFGCTLASSGTTGCLSGTDYTTFNNKQGTISVTWPITLSGATIGFNGLSTSTAATIGNILYFTGVNTVGNVGTSTLSATTPLTGSFTHVGSGGSLGIQAADATHNGYLSATDFTLLHSATTTFSSPLVYTLSTNAVTCPTCGAGTVTSVTATQPILSSGGATPNIIFTGLSTTTQPASSNVLISDGKNGVYGAATSSDSCSAPLSCSGFNAFGEGGAISLSNLTVANGGTGQTTFGQGWIYSLGGTTALNSSTSPTVNYITATSTTATSTFADGISLTGGCFFVNGSCVSATNPAGTGSEIQYRASASAFGAVPNSGVNLSGGWAGFGTTTPAYNLQLSSSTAPQLTVSDGTNNGWAFRNAGGSLYLATTSPTTLGTTSTPSAISITPSSITRLQIGSTTGAITTLGGSQAVAMFDNPPTGNGAVASSTVIIGDTSTTTSRGGMQTNNTAGNTVCFFIVGTTPTATLGKCQ